jgi:hypothetical protein
VRIVPTIGKPKPVPFQIIGAGSKLRILFVYADPQNQTFVGWPGVRASIERVFSARLPANDYELKVIRGTAEELVEAFQAKNERYDIFQFSGHGEVDANGEGHILLLNQNNSQSSPMSAGNLANILSGRGIKLAVISACSTAAGNAADPFNVVAEALVSNGIPAVVANLLPVPESSVASFVGAMYAQLLNTGDIGPGHPRVTTRLHRILALLRLGEARHGRFARGRTVAPRANRAEADHARDAPQHTGCGRTLLPSSSCRLNPSFRPKTRLAVT